MRKVKDMLRPAALRELAPGRQLAVWMTFHSLGQVELAALCGTARGTLAGVLSGKRASRPLVEKIAAEAGLDADELEADLRGE